MKPCALAVLAVWVGLVGWSQAGPPSGEIVPAQVVLEPATTPIVIDAVPVETTLPSGPRFWATAEYLMWWIKNGPMPVPVATSAPANSTEFVPGALGNPDTTVLLGGRDIDHPLHHGGLFTAGTWLDCEQLLGIEGSYFFLGNRSVRQSTSSTAAANAPFLVNPFFDVAFGDPNAPGGSESANFLADPLGTAGSVELNATSRLQGAELNALLGVRRTATTQLTLIGGFRFLELKEGIDLTTTQTDPLEIFFPGQFVNTLDSFDTRNDFYAGQIGMRLDYSRGLFFVQTTGKIAFGSTHETVRIQGSTTTNTGPNFASEIPTTTAPGGIYALPTNIGSYSRNRFGVAPEVAIRAGMYLGDYVRIFVGYNFLYLSEVVRPGDQIDRTINSTQLTSFTGVPSGPLVGAPRPAPLLNSSSFWAQGINFGLAVQW